MRTAVRYKVDASGITAGVAKELSGKRKHGKRLSSNLQKRGNSKRLK